MTLIEQTLAELAARYEINTRRLALLNADPSFRRIDPNTLHETYTCAPATVEAIRETIREVCASFKVDPAQLGFCL